MTNEATMITVLSTTNRKNSLTRKLAQSYFKILQQRSRAKTDFFALEDLPFDFVSSEMYSEKKSTQFKKIEQDILLPSEKFVFVIPEYNGSYPGILKTMVDACDVKKVFFGKKAALVGISSGKTGNLRGMDHFSDVLNHIKINVLYDKVRVARVDSVFDNTQQLVNQKTIERIQIQIDELLHF